MGTILIFLGITVGLIGLGFLLGKKSNNIIVKPGIRDKQEDKDKVKEIKKRN